MGENIFWENWARNRVENEEKNSTNFGARLLRRPLGIAAKATKKRGFLPKALPNWESFE